MFGFKVLINTVVTNKDGSGYALATGCVNRMFVLENVAFYKKLVRIERQSHATSIVTGSIYLPTSGSSKLTEAQVKLQQPFIEFYV
nr:acetyl-coenzyme A carboxylase carboxyl transferase subunit alpha, chloroplastic-like [Tanacetum cinerariifolium]